MVVHTIRLSNFFLRFEMLILESSHRVRRHFVNPMGKATLRLVLTTFEVYEFILVRVGISRIQSLKGSRKKMARV